MIEGNSIGIGMIFSWVLWLFIVAVVTYTILWSFRQFGYQRPARSRLDTSTPTDETSLSILEQRDEDDEIDQTQFDALKNQLS